MYCPLSQINVVTDFNIVDPDDTTIAAVYVQISTGYDLGNDFLTLTGAIQILQLLGVQLKES